MAYVQLFLWTPCARIEWCTNAALFYYIQFTTVNVTVEYSALCRLVQCKNMCTMTSQAVHCRLHNSDVSEMQWTVNTVFCLTLHGPTAATTHQLAALWMHFAQCTALVCTLCEVHYALVCKLCTSVHILHYALVCILCTVHMHWVVSLTENFTSTSWLPSDGIQKALPWKNLQTVQF